MSTTPPTDGSSTEDQRDAFFANISHEFRTPLSVIAGMAELIRSDPAQWVEQGTELIRLNAQDLMNLVDQILDLQRSGQEQWQLDLIQADVIPFLAQRAAMFEGLAKSKGLAFHVDIRVESCVMDVDPNKLLRILSNMLGNAIKFTDTGEVKLILDIEQTDDGDQLRMEFIDSGIGIRPENQERIFARFYQADTEQARVGQGTGIGLELVQGIVRLMKGDIKLKSAPGVGSRFIICLPITREAEAAELSRTISQGRAQLAPPTLPAGVSSTGVGPSLLVIEDHSDLRQMLLGQLSDAYQVTLARDGEEGVAKAQEFVPDIIVSDVMMPKKDGYQVLEELRAHPLTCHIPIILLTGKADAESRLAGLRLGADAYLAKPYVIEELELHLDNLLSLRDRMLKHYSIEGPSGQASPSPGNDPRDPFMVELESVLLAHMDQGDFGIREICRVMGISRTQLHNKLTSLTGQSTSRFIRRWRLHQAKSLLRDSSLAVSEVAYAVGFQQPSYFSNSFKSEFGCSPSDFREED